MTAYLGLPVEASQHAFAVDRLTGMIHWLMLALFIGWGAFFLFTLVRFRASRNPKADYVGVRSHTSSYLEVVVACIEIVLLIGFSIPLWAHRVNQEQFPSEKDAVVVKVMAEQFAWNIHYPGPDGIFGKQDVKLISSDNPMGLDRSDPNGKDDVLTVNQLHFPVNKPVIIYLSTKDVIHSFALQQMRVKQDAIPGSMIPLWFVPIKTSDQVREEMTEEVPARVGAVPKGWVAMDNYSGKDGAVLVKKMDVLTDDVIQKLAAAGIEKVKTAPATPTEITCAQLCGLGHYRMRGYYTVETQEQFDKWLKDQAPAAGSQGGSSYE